MAPGAQAVELGRRGSGGMEQHKPRVRGLLRGKDTCLGPEV